MDDTLLVSRAIAGDLDSFGQLYDQYFNRVYDFVWRILRDNDEAADVTQDVFMKAMHGLPGLAKAASFKSWLFTIAHNAAISRAERAGRAVPLPPSHEEAFGSFDVPDPCRIDNPAIAAEDRDLASLVWEAATALNPRDYAVLDLHVRQGLESAEIADVMGVTKGNAYTMVSRMKTAAADVIGSYVVARRGSKDCEGLQQVLAAFVFPPYTAEVRKAVDAHVKDCETCTRARKALLAPLEIFGAFAAVPAPFALKGDIWGGIAGGWPLRAGSAEASGMPGEGGDGALAVAGGAGGGFGGYDTAIAGDGAGGGDSTRSRILLFAAAAVGLLLFAFGGGALIAATLGGGDDGGAGGSPSGATATAAGSTSVALTPGVSVETPTPGDATETPEVTETEEPSATAGPTDIPATPTKTTKPVSPTKTVPPTRTPVPTRTPKPTQTPKPTKTPTPTRTPRGGGETPPPPQ